MTAVLDPGALLNAGPGHTIGEFFGVGGLDIAPRHHRGHAGRWSTSPAMWSPAAGTFLDRACAVEWDTERPTGHLGHLAYAELPAKGKPRTGPDGAPLTGSWLPDGDAYTELGHAHPALIEDDDRAKPPPRPGKGPNWHLGLALAGLAGLVIVACCMTDGGGFE